MKRLQSFLINCNIVFALVFIVLMILNVYNPAMLFLSSTVSKLFLLAFCLCAIGLGVVSMVLDYRAEKLRIARARQRMRERRMRQG